MNEKELKELQKSLKDYMPVKEKIDSSLNPIRREKAKRPDYSEKFQENLMMKLFEEDLEEKKQKLLKNKESGDEYYEDYKSIHKKARTGKWDVLKDDKIYYFDPTLSYELTGYRPITMYDGLDFDPTPFKEVGETFDRTGRFCEYPRGTKPYRDWWNEQKRRCVEGYTVNGYRVTGDHYFFLNFYRMSTVNNDATKAGAGRMEGFPNFIAKQYEFFHYVEMCEMLSMDVCILKSRGIK